MDCSPSQPRGLFLDSISAQTAELAGAESEQEVSREMQNSGDQKIGNVH